MVIRRSAIQIYVYLHTETHWTTLDGAPKPYI